MSNPILQSRQQHFPESKSHTERDVEINGHLAAAAAGQGRGGGFLSEMILKKILIALV